MYINDIQFYEEIKYISKLYKRITKLNVVCRIRDGHVIYSMPKGWLLDDYKKIIMFLRIHIKLYKKDPGKSIPFLEAAMITTSLDALGDPEIAVLYGYIAALIDIYNDRNL